MEEQVLKDFIATVQKNDYNYDVVMPKFPELKDVDLQVLKDYVATAEANNYDYSIINPKFPELGFDVKKKEESEPSLDTEVTTESTTEQAPAEDGLSVSQPSEPSEFDPEKFSAPEQPLVKDAYPGDTRTEFESEETTIEPSEFDPSKFVAPEQPLVKDAYPGLFEAESDLVDRVGDKLARKYDRLGEDVEEFMPEMYADALDEVREDKKFISSYDALPEELKAKIEPGVIRKNGKIVGLDQSLIPTESVKEIIKQYDKEEFEDTEGVIENLAGAIESQRKEDLFVKFKKAGQLKQDILENKVKIGELRKQGNNLLADQLSIPLNSTIEEYNNLVKEANEDSIIINSLDIISENEDMLAIESMAATTAGTISAYTLSAPKKLLASLTHLGGKLGFGNPIMAEKITESLMKDALEIEESARETFGQDYRDKKSNFVGETLGQIGFVVASTALGGTPAALSAGYTMSTGEMYREAKNSGLSHNDAMNLSMVYGAISARLEMLPLKGAFKKLTAKNVRKKIIQEIIKEGGKNFTKEFAEKTVKLSLKPILKETLKESAEEGFQEGAQYLLSKGLAETYNTLKDEDKPEFLKAKFGSDEFFAELGENVLLGSVAGSIGSVSLNLAGGNVFVGSDYKAMEKMFTDPNQMAKVDQQLNSYRKTGQIKTDEELQSAKEQVGIVAQAASEVQNATKNSKISIGLKKQLFKLTSEKISLEKAIEGVKTTSLVSDKKQTIQDLDQRISDIVSGKITEKDIVAEQEAAMAAKTEAEAIVAEDVELTEELRQEVKDIEAFFADSDKKISDNLAVNKEEKVELSEAAKQTTEFAQKASSAISSILPNTKIVLHNTTEEYTPFKSAEGISRGEYNPQTNTVHIDLSVADSKTVAHEVFHAVLLNKIKTEEQIQTVTKSMYDSVKQSLEAVPEISTRIENFSKMYEENLQSEEALAELTGILSSEYKQLNEPTKLIVKKWVNDIASFFGLDNVIKLTKDEEVIDLLNTLSKKVATGKQVTEKDIKSIKQKDERKKETAEGNKLFNKKQLQDATKIANRISERTGINYKDAERISKLDKERAKKISDSYEKAKSEPEKREVKEAYSALIDETILQYEEILLDGYTVEVSNDEYSNSGEMIDDLIENKNMRIFSTESGFGAEGITDAARKSNPMLKKTKFKDKNGVPLLVNDVFRFVHDFFGHAKMGNGFGPLGEENAWNVHSRMYSPLARRAMTTETRGQNSWVNFSGVNEKAFKVRDEARALRKKAQSSDNKKDAIALLREAERKINEVYDMMDFAEQKVALLPEEFTKTDDEISEAQQQRATREQKVSDEETQAIKKVSELPTSIQESLDFAEKSAFNNKLEFKKALQDRFNKDTYSKIKDTYNVKDNKSNNDPGLKDYLIDAYLNETLTAIEAYPDALGWYDSRINGAMSFMEELHPELATDKNAESAFKIALAITSNGNKVYGNFVEANRQYEYFKENGEFDENYSIGDQVKGILPTLRFTNKALQSMSMSEFTNFLTSKYRAGDLKYIKNGKKTPLLPGFAVDEEVYGASIFGPKIGNGFFMNLYGEFNQLTMDRWFMRQYGRITGTLLDFDQAKVDKGDARLKKSIKGLGVKRSKVLESIVPNFKNISNEELANKIQKASMDLNKRALFKSDIKLNEVRKAGNNLSKLYSAEVEAPKNSSQRKFINEVFSELQSKLKEDYGIDITIADLQAVNWYPEKALYQTFKADQNVKQGKVNTSDNEQPDYQSAARKLIKIKGISENKIKENERRRSEQTKGEDTDRKSIEQGARQFNKSNIKTSEIKRLKDKIISIKEEVTSNDLKEVATTPASREQKMEDAKAPGERITTTVKQTLFKGMQSKTKGGKPFSVHKIKKGSFAAIDKTLASDYKGDKPLKEFTVPIGTTVDVVKVQDTNQGFKKIRTLEEGLIDNSDAQIVKLITQDARGYSEQYIIKDDSILEAAETKTTPASREQRIGDEDIESIIIEARNNNFTDEAIKYYLVNVKKQPATKVNELLEFNVNLLDRMPKSFGNIEGGAAKGVKLFDKVQKYHTKLNKSNNKRKPANRLNEQQIVDEVIKFLEKQPEYKKEGFPKKKEISTQQAAMLSDIQKSVRMRPTAEMAEKIREARMVLAQRKKGIADIKKVQSAVRNFMRKALPKKLYTKSETLKLINKINDATVKNIDSVIAEVEKFVIEQNIKDLNAKVSNLLDISRYTKTQAGKKVAKKIDSETLERVKYINKNILSNKATAEQIDARNAELNREFNEISAKTDLTVADVQRMSDISIITGYNNSLQMDNQDATKVTQLDSVIAQLEGVIEYGSSQLAERIAEQKRETDRIFEVGYKAVTGTDIDLSAENANQVLEDKDFEFEYKKERKRLGNKLSRKLSEIGTSIKEGMFGTAEALDGLMDKINILPAELFGGELQEEFTNKIDEANRTFKERRMMAETTIKDKLVELYGKRWVNESRKNRDTINTGIYRNEAAKKKDMPIMLSQNQMAYYYNQYKDPANRDSFANTFGTEYERVMEEMTNKLDPKVKQLADWQVDEFYPSLYKYYNDAYKKIYNADMPWNQFYAGILYRKGETIEPLDLLADKTIYNTAVGANSTKSRVQNNNKIEGMDMVDVMATYINQMEYFAAYSQPIREMNTFFKNKYIRNAIETIHNKQTMKLIDAMIEKIANKGGKQEFGDEFVNALNSTFVTSRIGLSPVVMIKQLLSIPTYANDIGIINWTKYSAKNATQLAKTWKEVRDNSVYMQDRRNDSILRTIETYKDSDMVEFVPSPTKRWIVDFLMYTTKFGDRTAIMLGGMPNYLYYKDQELKKGKTEQQAIDIAIKKFERDTKRTQQSADLQDKDYFQTKGAITRALNMFLTTPKQYLRKEIQAVRNLGRMMSKSEKAAKGTFTQNFRTFVMYHAFLPVLFQYVTLGLPGILREWRDDEDDKDLWRAAILGNLNALFLYGEIFAAAGDLLTGKPWAGEQTRTVGLIQSSMNVIKKLKKAMTIQDEDKKEKAQKDAILELVNITGAPASTIDKMIQNYKEIGTDDDLGKDIMRLLNYSKYQIEGPKKKKKRFAGPSTTSMTDLKKYAPSLYDEIKAIDKELKVDID